MVRCVKFIIVICLISTDFVFSTDYNIHENTIIASINKKRSAGHITEEQALLQKAYTLFNPQKLDKDFRYPQINLAKCGTSVFQELIS